jgi:hypothetical protein
MMIHACKPSTLEAEVGLVFKANIGYMVRPCLKQNPVNRAGGMAQVVHPLPSKYKALSSNTSTAKINTGQVCLTSRGIHL